MGSVPALIKRVIEEHRWQERFVRVTGTETRFNRFTEFIAAEPPEGLGAELPAIKRLCANDPTALDLIDQATKRPNGVHTGAIDIVNSTPDGNSADQAIRRLRKDRPDLHAKVLAKELSPHAAMVEAGFRRKTVSVPVDDPDKVSALPHRLWYTFSTDGASHPATSG